MTFVHQESLSKLLCYTCKKYLSYFPIHTNTSGSTCGRCQPLESAIHNEVYENLAEKQKFPCSHNRNGCLENLFPKSIPEHEKFCSYRKFNCPTTTIPSCICKLYIKDLLQHFEEKHPTLLLSEGNFEVDFVNSHKENYLLPFGESLYIVSCFNDSTTNTFSCNVTYLGTDSVVEEYCYKMVLKCGSGARTHEICKKLGEVTDIDKKLISSILNDPVSIVAQIEIYKDDSETKVDEEEVDSSIQWDFLRELECLVCMEYMVPPIFQCITGHSICKACKDKVKECPTCKGEIGSTQNFALAQLISYIDYPCKYDRCKFKAKPAEIKTHEANCSFGTITCPLKDFVGCEAQMTSCDLYQHLSSKHYESLLETDTVCEPFEEGKSIEECYIVKYHEKLFRLDFFYHSDSLAWLMQLIGPAEDSSLYYFDIDIIDSSGAGKRAYYKESCLPLLDFSDAQHAQGGIEWQYEDVKHLITTELRYRVHVSTKKE